MTAIYAYASGDIAFVAGDTRRGFNRGMIPVTSCKLHRWSDHVLLAAAGEAEFLTDLIHRMLSRVAPLSPTSADFICTFRQVHDNYWARAQRRYNGASPSGTVLVASAAHGGIPANIVEIDFATALPTTISGVTHAHGSCPTQFQADATRLLAACTTSTGIELDRWGAMCIDAAVTQSPGTVDWPADLLIVRPQGNEKMLTMRRVPSASITPHPSFLA